MSLSSRPYLIRALYDWMSENNLTPQILIDTTVAGVRVPAQFANDERLLLNISMSATRDLFLGDDEIAFNARFGGVSQSLSVPVSAVLAIVARETEAVMVFGSEPSLGVPGDIVEHVANEQVSSSMEDRPDAGVMSRSDDDNVVHVQFGREPKNQ